MKHLLNDLSEAEKNSIREQHRGGMLVDTTKFYTLLESKLGNVKPLTEAFTMDQAKMAAAAMGSCYSPKNYPVLAEVSKDSIMIVFGLLTLYLGATTEVASFGLSSIISGAAMGLGASTAMENAKKIYKSELSRITPELKELAKCVLGYRE